MPYVRRDQQGQLLSLHRKAEPGAEEFVADDAAELQAFVVSMGVIDPGSEVDNDGFWRLDADFVRVLEDLIDVLISRHVINITDLPAEAQNKLYKRRSHRHSTSLSRLNLLGDEPVDNDYVEPENAAAILP